MILNKIILKSEFGLRLSLFLRNQEIPRRRAGNAEAPSDCFCVVKSVTLQPGNPYLPVTGTPEKAKRRVFHG